MSPTIHLSPKELAVRLRFIKRDGSPNTQTLANWRVAGKGPKFIKHGNVILYPIAEVESWEAASLMRSTAG